MKQFKPVILLGAIVLMAGATSGEKELIIRLQGEVIVLQRQIRDLQESFDRWQGQSNAAMQKLTENTSITAREITTIDEALRNSRTAQSNSLAGASASLQRMTEILSGHGRSFDQLGRQMESLDRSIQDLQRRQEQFEKRMESREIGSTGDSPEALYAAAYVHFVRGEYEKARQGFRGFLQRQPDGADSDDALYWIGESWFLQGRYAEALVEFDRVLGGEGDRKQGALLRRGLSLLHLERRDEGIAVLRDVIGRFPQSREAGLAREELRRLGV